jgi:hypothetical protein
VQTYQRLELINFPVYNHHMNLLVVRGDWKCCLILSVLGVGWFKATRALSRYSCYYILEDDRRAKLPGTGSM